MKDWKGDNDCLGLREQEGKQTFCDSLVVVVVDDDDAAAAIINELGRWEESEDR